MNAESFIFGLIAILFILKTNRECNQSRPQLNWLTPVIRLASSGGINGGTQYVSSIYPPDSIRSLRIFLASSTKCPRL